MAMKLPTGYGCETTNGDDASNGRSASAAQDGEDCVNGVLRPASQQNQYHNLPVAVAVPVTGIRSSAATTAAQSPDRARARRPRRGAGSRRTTSRSARSRAPSSSAWPTSPASPSWS